MAAIPRPQAPLVDAGGFPSREWYTYWQGLALASTGSGWEASFKGLAERVTTLEKTAPKALIGMQSIQINGIYAQLDGDIDLPGATWYYGSGPDSVRGWYPLADTLAVTEDLTKAVDDETGVATFGLADLPDTGIGAALVKITRDGKGRVAGTEEATTSDLPEGSSLYFTNARAQDAAGAVVDGSGDVELHYEASPARRIWAVLSAGVQAAIAKALSAIQPNDPVSALANDAGFIDYTGLKGSLVAGANVTLTPDDSGKTITITSTGSGGGGSGSVDTVTGGAGIAIDNTDPSNPVVALSATAQASIAKAETAAQSAVTISTTAPLAGGGDLSASRTLSISPATNAAAGSMSAADKAKLDGIAAGATANEGTVTSVAVANATGITWAGSPITGAGTLTPELSENLQAWSGIAPSVKADASALSGYVAKAGDTMTGVLAAPSYMSDYSDDGTVRRGAYRTGGYAGRGFYDDGTDFRVGYDGAWKLIWTENNFDPNSKQNSLGYTPVNKSGDTMVGQLMSYELGYATPGIDRPLLTKQYDVFTAGNYSGLGRWGVFMEFAQIGFGMPAGNSGPRAIFYNADGSIAENHALWHAGNSAQVIVSSSTPAYVEGAIWVQP